jgi:hypothetical protein
MGVLANSSLMKSGTAERGVLADRAWSSEGKEAVTGVVNWASFGLLEGILAASRLWRDGRFDVANVWQAEVKSSE